MKRFFSLITFLLLASCGPAQEPNDLTYIRAGVLIDVLNGETLQDQMITVDGERIIEVKNWPAGVEAALNGFIDWSDYTVLPGLIDGHSHLIGDIQSDDVMAPLYSSWQNDITLGVLNAEKTLKAGFTSVIDLGAYRGFTDVELRDAINSGDVLGPRMWVSGAYITISGGGGEVVGLNRGVDIPDDFRRGVADNEAEVRSRVRELIEGGADQIKMIATGAVLTVGTDVSSSEFSEREITAAVEEAAKLGKYVTAHAHGAEGIKSAIRAGVRSIQHGSLMDDEGISLMKEYGTWLVADIYNGDYINEVGTAEGWPEETMQKNRDTTDAQREMFQKAVERGVNIAFGTDSGVYPHGTNARQFAYMVRYGLTPMEAIQSATIWGAKSMSLENDIGSIESGKFADLIAVKGDVLEDITLLENVDAVILGGKLIE